MSIFIICVDYIDIQFVQWESDNNETKAYSTAQYSTESVNVMIIWYVIVDLIYSLLAYKFTVSQSVSPFIVNSPPFPD